MSESKWYYDRTDVEVLKDEALLNLAEQVGASDVGVFIMDEKGNIIGDQDDKKWKAAKWYQKFIAFFSKKYKQRFFNIKPMKFITKS